MRTQAVRLYGSRDLRLESFELPSPGKDEILARIISDTLCMSTYKTAEQGAKHKRVPADVAAHPVIIGHECCGEILSAGSKWSGTFRPGDRFALQPVVNEKTFATVGYSYRTVGGSATAVLIPDEVISAGCLLPYHGDAFFRGSLAEPMSCIISAFRASWHRADASLPPEGGIAAGGRMAILAGAGPMGLGAIDFALNGPRNPSVLAVTDINTERLARAKRIFPPESAAKKGIKLLFLDTSRPEAEEELRAFSGGSGFDDIFVLAPVSSAVEQADRLLARGGCLNFFAGPVDPLFHAAFNFYNVHYNGTHTVGTSGGTPADMREALRLMDEGRIHPEVMITHVGGLDAVIPAVLNLPAIPGGKKLIYPGISMPLTAIDSFAAEGKNSQQAAKLAEICARHSGLWSAEAEAVLLAGTDNQKKQE